MARASKISVRTSGTYSAGLPSIAELGFILGTITRREAAIDIQNLGRGEPADDEQRLAWLTEDRRTMTADRLLYGQLDSLRSLVTRMPAKTLSDCVVQVNVAGLLLFKINGVALEPSELNDAHDAIERVLVSILPVMAAAAGMDLVEYGLDEVASMIAERFPELAA